LEEVYCIHTAGCRNSSSVHSDVISAIMETITRSLMRYLIFTTTATVLKQKGRKSLLWQF